MQGNVVGVVALLFILSILYASQCRQLSCNLPPAVWCSSREVARTCGVEEQCHDQVWSLWGVDDLVELTVYIESLCPDCKEFINGQLWSTYIKLASIMNLRVVPYGNANEKLKGGKWVFECQHGEDECVGNLIETCAIHIYNKTNIWFPFIVCIEKSDLLPAVSAPQCAKKFGIDFDGVEKCVNSSLGNQLEHEMALETDNLQPPHTYVPWVTLNGVHTDEIQKLAENDLTKLICDTYKGSTRPEACQAKSSHSFN